MASLKTQGFALSELPSAPKVPGNIGVVDVKAIDQGVRERLATLEAVRSQLPRMILADTQMQAATLQAPLATRRVLAETNAMEEQLPMKTAILAAESSPEFLEARRRHLLASTLPSGLREFDLLTKDMSPDEREAALRVKYGLDPRKSSAAITYQKVIGSDGREQLVAVDPRAVGAHVIGSGQTYGSGVGTVPVPAQAVVTSPPAAIVEGVTTGSSPGSVITITAPVTTAAPAPNPFASPSIQEKSSQAATGTKTAEMKAEAQFKLPKARATIESLEAATSRVESDINQAIQLVSRWNTGVGAVLKNLPETEARKLDGLLLSIRSNVGFDALTSMRQNSPTGGALGNVSDYEGRQLQAVLATMDQYGKPEDLREALVKVRERRREALLRSRNAYERDLDAYGVAEAASPTTPVPAAPPPSKFRIIEIK